MHPAQDTPSAIDELPSPSTDALASSRALIELIDEECASQGGRITFRRYMELALYHPGYGYYTGGSRKLGESGDFITAPEISPLFSRCLANQCAEAMAALDAPVIIEFGAGSGVMAADILGQLETLSCLPEKYLIIELSGELRERQQVTIAERVPELLDRVIWLDAMPEDPLDAVVLANEVLDAMPVEGFQRSGEDIYQLCVRREGDKLITDYIESDPAFRETVERIEERIGSKLPDTYRSEFNPMIEPWLRTVREGLNKGVVLLIDYGYHASEYYQPDRHMGTLMCHYRHRAHPDAMIYPGLQDITAFVDFTAVAYAADELGFDVRGYATQAAFLMGCGLGELHQNEVTDEVRDQIMLSQQVKTLTMPSEMGERFKVMALTLGVDSTLRGFALQDMRGRL